VVFVRQRQRDLALEVEVLLAADREFARDPVGAGGDRGVGVAAAQAHRRQHVRLRLQRLLDGEDGRQRLDLAAHPGRGLAGPAMTVGDHERDHLAHVQHLAVGEDGFVVGRRGEVPVGGDVGRREHRDHARHGQRGAGIDAQQPAVGDRAEDRSRVQRVGRQRHVVDEAGLAGDVRAGALVRPRAAGDAGVGFGAGCGRGDGGRAGLFGGVHGLGSSACSGGDVASVSCHRRSSRLPATARR
jgi:hypothetical protein